MARAVERAGEEGVRQAWPAAAVPERPPSLVPVPDVHARVLGLQRTAGNAAVARLLGGAVVARRAAAPAPSSITTYAHEAPSEDEVDVVSNTSGPHSQGATTPPAPPAPPAPAAPPAPPAPPAAPACVLTTRTVAAAPDGTANTRTTVGVNEQVVMTAPAVGVWTTTGGRLSATTGATVTWTAPVAPSGGQTFTVASTPPAGSPCSVSMTVVPPARRRLTVRPNAAVPPGQRVYTAGQAGSGFVANVRIHPLSVSFSRLQVREGTVAAVATGYYNTVLGWNGNVHPLGTWLTLDASNGGIIDTVGTNPPGSPAPFSPGAFTWPIPQFYRRVGSTGNGRRYSVGTHRQVMTASAGVETTSKEGASRTR